jgi:hypothetical protein
VNSICSQQPPKFFTIPYLFYTKLMKKCNENVFANKLSHTFIFKAIDINHQSCQPYFTNSETI